MNIKEEDMFIDMMHSMGMHALAHNINSMVEFMLTPTIASVVVAMVIYCVCLAFCVVSPLLIQMGLPPGAIFGILGGYNAYQLGGISHLVPAIAFLVLAFLLFDIAYKRKAKSDLEEMRAQIKIQYPKHSR